MRRGSIGVITRTLLLAMAVSAACASVAGAFDMPADSLLRVGGRFEYRIETAGQSAPFPWNYSSRSVVDRSRLMLDLFSGRERYGWLYLKGAAEWSAARASGEIDFLFEQGDYYWRLVRKRSEFEVRLFANERRYFTHELSTPLLEDDVVTSFDDQFGIRHDGSAGNAAWTALGAVLGDEWSRADKFYFLRGGWFGRYAQASAAYTRSTPAPDTLDHHAIIKGEVSASYRQFGAVASYAYSGFGKDGFFVPGGDGDGDGGGSWPYPDGTAPGGNENAALFAELRVLRFPIAGTGLYSLVYQHSENGDAWVDRLGGQPGGARERLLGLYYAALKKAIDVRLEYIGRDRTRFDDKSADRFEGMARAQLVNGAETYLRGGYGDYRDETGRTGESGFVHAAWRRNGRKITSGVHVMLLDRTNAEMEERFGVEARFNFTASVSLYGRLIASQQVASRDAVFLRLDMRPTEWMFAAVGYGRYYIGDEPYMLEDPDIGRRGETESVWFIRVRGDF
jgi:hypothetical protein